ncbi:MAG: hypothetical protein ABFC34_16795 [Methanobacterium sp.]
MQRRSPSPVICALGIQLTDEMNCQLSSRVPEDYFRKVDSRL